MSLGERVPRILRRPSQGWSSLLLLLGMLAIVGSSVADARPLWLDEARGPVTDALVPVMLSAGLIGYLLARSSIGIVRAHIVGAAVAAFMLLFVAGSALIEGASPLPTSLDGIGERVAAVWQRLDADMAGFLGAEAATPTVATFLVLGAICWTTAQFSAFSIFRYDRGGPAVMATGAVLFLNVGLGSLVTDAELLPVVPVLAVFSALSMLLLMRMQLGQQRRQWARRHIADSGEVSRLFLRSGLVFVLLTVMAATSLTTWATMDAREVDIGSLQAPVQDVIEEIARYLPILGIELPTETPPVRPDDRWSVDDVWDRPNGVAFRARVEDGRLRRNYWWGWAHDQFDGRSWDRQRLGSVPVAANAPIPYAEEASAGGEHTAATEITIESTGPVQGMVFRLPEADVIDRGVVAYRVDDGPGIAEIEFVDALEPGEVVRIDSLVRDYREDATSLTATQLREAGTGYPGWVLDRYLQGTEADVSGTRIDGVADRIGRREDNPYDRAIAAQQLLQGMDYTTDMQGVCRDDEPIPDCVLRTERGFCQHYATTMTMLLRELDIPARIITGYLPGELQGDEWVVEQAAFHNWVEAYFPVYGWVRFDPTPRAEFGMTPTLLPEGPEETFVPGGANDAEVEPEPDPSEPAETFPPEELPVVDGPRDDDLAASLLIGAGLALALTVVVAGLLLFRFRRLATGDAGLAYRGIVSLATRLGHGPHPSQTEYEYAGSLSETIPAVREDLHVVVDARVETAYGHRSLDRQRQGALRQAYARVRTALLRVWLRLRR